MQRLFILIMFIFKISLLADTFPIKEFEPQKLKTRPTIDGIINDDVWQNKEELTNFVQYYPQNGEPPTYQTYIKIYYTDNSIFVAANMIDETPDSIDRELGPRDSFESVEADLFAVNISPYNDGVNSYGFMVSASGVQSDINYISDNEDPNWDAVWKSAVNISENGWTAEIEIPYSALRFPQKELQTWGLNFFRMIKRKNQWSTWNRTNIKNEVWWSNMGQLTNLKNIDPPLRLSLIPYVSGYIENNTDNEWGTIYNGGMDLKYGFNESFTLDMTLIPDFKQTQSDNVRLNLSPFELHYDEKRQFFIEGMELFNKGDIFYTRRIGGVPAERNAVEDNIAGNETIIENPKESRLLNSTKISGRTKNGLGVGIFNGITAKSEATIKDTVTGEKRSITTQPLTNYNMIVLDQTLGNNSYISLANTNMYNNWLTADVIATEFKINDKSKTYRIEGTGAMSNQFFNDSTSRGHHLNLDAGKIDGRFQFEYEFNLESDTYNPNDMGFMRQNNEIENQLSLEYNIHKPTQFFIEQHYSVDFRYTELYKPKKFRNFRIDQSFNGVFKNLNHWRYHAAWQPQHEHDYYEAREKNRLFVKPALLHFCSSFSTAQKRKFHYTIFGGYNHYYSDFLTYDSFHFMINPKFRINNKAAVEYEWYFSKAINDRGYADTIDDSNEIIFGRRTTIENTNTISAKYTINNKSNIDFRLRHYFSNADFHQFYTLHENGYLSPNNSYDKNCDINYNAFNIDFIYSWNFAPGSFLNIVWKNSIYEDGETIYRRWSDNFSNTLTAPQTNSFSLKVLYYFDYGK